jgi:hypothetical protein
LLDFIVSAFARKWSNFGRLALAGGLRFDQRGEEVRDDGEGCGVVCVADT